MKINTGTLNNSTSFERNYGIDLLRILSMLMVVVLHILGCGGVIAACERFSFNYYVAWYLEAAAYCAVDVFAMITGYVMINGKFNTFKMIPLWLTVFFYSSLIAILFEFVPALAFLYKPSLMELLKSICIPVVSRQYWYFTSYFGLFFFIPFINTLLHNLNEKQHRVLCLTIIILFSILPLLGLKQIDTFSIGGGYTTVWLICLYTIGSYFKLYPVKILKRVCFAVYMIAITCAWFARLLSHFVIKALFHMEKELDLFIDYTSIFIIISGISLLLLFGQLKIRNLFLCKIIAFISGLSFSVYLIHVHPFVIEYIIKNLFIDTIFNNAALLILKVFGVSLLIFLICIVLDLPRHFLFIILRIYRLPKKMQNRYCSEQK